MIRQLLKNREIRTWLFSHLLFLEVQPLAPSRVKLHTVFDPPPVETIAPRIGRQKTSTQWRAVGTQLTPSQAGEGEIIVKKRTLDSLFSHRIDS